ncbi:SOLUBLE NSF ATTACHMENT PROTEIN SNAP [Salix purpurea]|uniref:SOLUBLE NSF ATTACHMENT PROTEIN SNAP n=1 Tax=Salix purpurea TaxID=77065 RepID=A0A9Q0VV67_SALPP|nr:SOLUBLE NSF ATTACHMENT PROTEIN SNAP [Salix purpurea]
MGDHIKKGEEFEKKAEKKISGWGLLGSKYEDASDLLTQSANQFKLAKSWDKAGSVFIKLSNCHLRSRIYAVVILIGAISCYLQAVDIYVDMGRYSMAAKYCKEIGELYELEQNIDKAILYFEKAADYFEFQESSSLANKCKLKVAEISAQLEQYQKAIQIYEDVARQSLNNNLLKYGVRGHLLNAGICQLCRGDVVAITNALEQYENLDPTFSRTREYKFLSDLATAIDEEDVPKLTSIIKEFDSISKLDSWKVALLLKVKNALKAKELEDDLT